MSHYPRILLFRGRGFISWAIRFQTRSPYSHAAVEISPGTIIESWQGAGVRQKHITDYRNVDAFTINFSPSTSPQYSPKLLIEFLQRQIGLRYDYRSVFRFLSRRTAPSNSSFFCSELVFASCLSAGLPLLSRIPPSHVSPGHLALSPYLTQTSPVPSHTHHPFNSD